MADDEEELVDRALDNEHGDADRVRAALPDQFHMTEDQVRRFTDPETPQEQYRQFTFKPEATGHGSHASPLYENKPESGDGYTVNLDSLAIRVGELRQVVDAVTEAGTTFTSCDGGDLGPGRINSAVAKVGADWMSNVDKLGAKITAMSSNLHSAVEGYHGADEQAWQRFAGGGKDAFADKYGTLEGDR